MDIATAVLWYVTPCGVNVTVQSAASVFRAKESLGRTRRHVQTTVSS
jgi:hypothetical protein